MSILSERLTQVAMEKQLSTRDIANATGTSKSAIQRYLSGERENVPVSFVQAFARAYSIENGKSAMAINHCAFAGRTHPKELARKRTPIHTDGTLAL